MIAQFDGIDNFQWSSRLSDLEYNHHLSQNPTYLYRYQKDTIALRKQNIYKLRLHLCNGCKPQYQSVENLYECE